ncbi:MAG: hypothetical protein ACREA7_05250 [Nitrosotalea sp.]
MDSDIVSYIAIGIAIVSAIIAFKQTMESKKQNNEVSKQTRLAYLPYILPRYYETRVGIMITGYHLGLENVGSGIAVDVHLDIFDSQGNSLLEKPFEIYAFDSKRVYEFQHINLENNKMLKITGYYFDTSHQQKHDVVIEFEYPPKIHKNNQ